jgi:hypothetical protein
MTHRCAAPRPNLPQLRGVGARRHGHLPDAAVERGDGDTDRGLAKLLSVALVYVGAPWRWYRRVVVVGFAVGLVRGLTARAAAPHLPAGQCAVGGVWDSSWSGHLTTVADRWCVRQSQRRVVDAVVGDEGGDRLAPACSYCM